MAGLFVPVITLGILGISFGLGLAYASKRFSVHFDPKIEKILAFLPNANCGACGQAGCLNFAESLVKQTAKIEACVACKSETRKQIAEILGVDVGEEHDAAVAFVSCGGGTKAQDKFMYYGINDCLAASMVLGGPKACNFACLGLGSCRDVCPVCAIKIIDGVAIINPDLCIGCHRCVKICPKKVITMVPRNKAWMRCASRDKGAEVMKLCKAGCIACTKCVKICPVNCIDMDNNLARIDHSRCIACGKCIEVCPTKCIDGSDISQAAVQSAGLNK